MDQKDIDRINELYHKYKAGTITEEEQRKGQGSVRSTSKPFGGT